MDIYPSRMDSLTSSSAVEVLNQVLEAKINTDYYLLFLTLMIRLDHKLHHHHPPPPHRHHHPRLLDL